MTIIEKIKNDNGSILLDYCAECTYYSLEALHEELEDEVELTDSIVMAYAIQLRNIYMKTTFDVSLSRLADALVRFRLDTPTQTVLEYYYDHMD